MLTVLLLLACGDAQPTAETPAPAPTEQEEPAVPDAAWVGDWVMDNKIIATDDKGVVKMMKEGEVVSSGQLTGKGLTRKLALEGCAATLKLSEVGGNITVDMGGRRCPVDFLGTFLNTVSP